MGALGRIFGGFIFVGSILGAVAWGIYAWILLGVFGIVNGATSAPVDANAIVWGVLWVVFLAKLSAVGVALVGMIIGGIIVAVSGGERRKAFGRW